MVEFEARINEIVAPKAPILPAKREMDPETKEFLAKNDWLDFEEIFLHERVTMPILLAHHNDDAFMKTLFPALGPLYTAKKLLAALAESATSVLASVSEPQSGN